MAYLIRTDRKNLALSLQTGLVRVPRAVRNRCDLSRVRKGDILFLVDPDELELFGPCYAGQEGPVLEKSPRSGPVNSSARGSHYLYDRITIDSSKAFSRGVVVSPSWLNGSDFLIEQSESDALISLLRHRNRSLCRAVLELSGDGNVLRATVVHGGSRAGIFRNSVELDGALQSSILNLTKRGQAALIEARFDDALEVIGLLGGLVRESILGPLLSGTNEKPGSGGSGSGEAGSEEPGLDLHVLCEKEAELFPFEISLDEVTPSEQHILCYRLPGRESESRALVKSVLIIADPERTHPAAFREGCSLFDFLSSQSIETRLVCRPVTGEMVERFFSEFDVVHFSGHAEEPGSMSPRYLVPGSDSPGNAGASGQPIADASGQPGIAGDRESPDRGCAWWNLGEGRFLSPKRLPIRVPRLLFSSACGSSLPLGWSLLRRGGCNAVTTRWRMPDSDLSPFLIEFYRELLQGCEIGCALWKAQRKYRGSLPQSALFVLMGDSRVTYEKQDT